jgi:hypothetical protein
LAVCPFYQDRGDLGKTHHCILTSQPIPINWGYCFSTPQNCPRYRSSGDIEKTPIAITPNRMIVWQDKLTIGVAATRLANASTPCNSILLKADADNSNDIWVGESDVAITKGVPLSAGESKVYDLEDVADLWAISDAASQVLWGEAIGG